MFFPKKTIYYQKKGIMTPFESTSINVILNITILLAAVAALWKGADNLVDSASRLACTIGCSDLVIGLTIVAFGTSAPEFAVTINAALNQLPDISVGNIVGSNIFNLGFILGSVAIVRSIKSTKMLIYRDGFFLIFVTLLLLFFFRDNHLSRYEGIILMSLLLSYLAFLFIKKEVHEEDEIIHEKSTWKDAIILPVSIATVIAGGYFLVDSASFLAIKAGISQWVIAVTIVAAGTSAPEMATSLAAVLKGKHGMSAGNLIGSDLFNIIGVLGLAGILHPMHINPSAYSSLLMLSGMCILVVVFLRTGWILSRKEGMILVAIGMARWVIDFMK
jgi:cation:H+ antiporter